MRHDIPKVGTMSEAYPHLIFHNFKTKLGERVNISYMHIVMYIYGHIHNTCAMFELTNQISLYHTQDTCVLCIKNIFIYFVGYEYT